MNSQLHLITLLLVFLPFNEVFGLNTPFPQSAKNIPACLNKFSRVWTYIEEGHQNSESNRISTVINNALKIVALAPSMAADCGFPVKFDANTQPDTDLCQEQMGAMFDAYSRIQKDGLIDKNTINALFKVLPYDLSIIHHYCSDLPNFESENLDISQEENTCLIELKQWWGGLIEVRNYIEDYEIKKAHGDIAGLVEAVPIILKHCGLSLDIAASPASNEESCFKLIESMYVNQGGDFERLSSFSRVSERVIHDFTKFYNQCGNVQEYKESSSFLA